MKKQVKTQVDSFFPLAERWAAASTVHTSACGFHFLEKKQKKLPEGSEFLAWDFPHSYLSKTWKWYVLLTLNLHFNISTFAPWLLPLWSLKLCRHLPHITILSTQGLRKSVVGQDFLLKTLLGISSLKNGYLITCVSD